MWLLKRGGKTDLFAVVYLLRRSFDLCREVFKMKFCIRP